MGILESLGIGGGGVNLNISEVASSVTALLSLIGKALLVVAPIAAVGYLLYRYRQYPISVDIFTQRGTTTLITTDRIGRFISTTGVEKHKFFSLIRRKKHIEPIPFDKIYLTSKGKNKAYLVESDKGVFYPVSAPIAGLLAESTSFTPISRATRFWENLEIKESLTNYSGKKWYVEFFPHISFVILAVFIILLFAMVKGDLAAVAASAADAARALGAVAQNPPTGAAPGW